MLCRCGLSNRNRLVLSCIKVLAAEEGATRILALESVSPFFAVLHRLFPLAVGSEFLGDDHFPGELVPLHGSTIRHEDVTRLSFPDSGFDLVTHNDILEHVDDYRRALTECHRVLRDGGQLIFTCPFFDQPEHTVRATIGDDGRAVHYQTAVYHGNPLSEHGSLVFRQFGWPILDDLREAGFRDALLGVNFDPFQGFLSNNNPYPDGSMMPVLFRAIKA
jgi:SAM-dependent methyltransferase